MQSSLSLTNAQGRGPSTQQERDNAVKISHLLETDPFNKDAKTMRQWLFKLITDVPDIHVTICTDLVHPLLGSKNPYEGELLMQQIFSMAAFEIEHPDQADDNTAVQMAGVEGILKTYDSILKLKPKAKSDFLNDLISKRDAGQLKPYVKGIATDKCKPKS